MYFCRIKKRKLKNKYKRNGIFIVIAASCVCFFALKESAWKVWGQELFDTVCMELTGLLVPGFAYDAAENGNGFLAAVQKQLFPAAGYCVRLQDYETEIESALSYEMILAWEALDENYVDENGQVVIQSVPSEETAEQMAGQETEPEGTPGENAASEEETAETEGSPAESAEESTLPAFTPAVEKVVEYPIEKLNDFDYLIQNFYQVDSTTTIKNDQLNAEALLEKDMTVAHDADTPQILIYHTHSLEGYADSVPGDASTTVVGVGDYLTEILTEQYGFNVIHDTGQYDTVRDKAYSVAAPAVEKILAENPQIDVVIDLHRDGVGENTRLVTNINGTDMAKVMFFNGLSRTTALGDISYLYNPYIADNLAFSFQMQLAAAEYYPGFTRKIYLKGYRFNMHYCPKTLLVEVGAQTNTVQEAMNAMVPLADILNKVLTQ